MSFVEVCDSSISFKKALGQVVETHGPLHMAFHMFQCALITHRNFIRSVQIVMQWKKLKFDKTLETLRGCKTMEFLAIEDVKLMWDLFLENKSDLVKNLTNSSGNETF